MEYFVPDHIHFLATSTLTKRHYTETNIADWLKRLVHAVDMEVLSGPYVCSCSDPGNEGVTGVIVLSTSHASVHIWTEKEIPYLKMDLYSCKRFAATTVIGMIEELHPRVIEYQIIDRNHASEDELLVGRMERLAHRSVDYRSQCA